MEYTRNFTYMKTNGMMPEKFDVYKVPQPTSVDMTYEVRIFTNEK
jgi:hypothetical protein